MKLLHKRGIGLRLATGFAVVLALLLGVAAVSALQVQQLQRQAEQLVSRHMAMLDLLGRTQQAVGERSVLLRDVVLNENLKVQREARQKLKANDAVEAELVGRLSQFADSSEIGDARARVQQIVGLVQETSRTEKAVLEKVADALYDDAKAIVADTLNGQQLAMNRLLRDSFVAMMADARQSVEANRGSERITLGVIAGSAALATLLGAAIAVLTSRSIVRPVEAARGATLQIAEGDLTQPIAARSRDEVGQLVAGLEWMRQALARSVADIRAAAESVRRGSREIEQGSGDVADRTQAQAATLEESAASMEQFTATVQQNAEGAGAASKLAREASLVAAQGGEAVRGVVATMQEIQAASARIGDIIGVIDGIAFQTNILALNAAVEAARAGEQGRGFAVVAAEVRSLAQRSAAAAKEIKGLVQDAGSRVGGGVRKVEDAGRVMDTVVASVNKVDALVADIARASAEQLAGIEQVNRAITQMDGDTQRNAQVVQQTAESARQMAVQAEALVDAVAKFKLLSHADVREPIGTRPHEPPAWQLARAESPGLLQAPG
jgi:methyl-accepting chemotaxis protein